MPVKNVPRLEFGLKLDVGLLSVVLEAACIASKPSIPCQRHYGVKYRGLNMAPEKTTST